MAPTTPPPSQRLLRAAAAERQQLRRHREQLLATRDTLRDELARVDASLREIEQRDALLDRLAGPAGQRVGTPTVAVVAPDRGGAETILLRGPAIRRAAVRVLLEHPERPSAMHYRDWFAALRQAGFGVAGKEPVAVFLTQLSRSPVVRKGTRSGVYELDPTAPRRLRRRLDALHEQLRGLTAGHPAAADIASVRARRAAITTEIDQVEKALEEAQSVLAADAAADPVALTR